MSKLRYTIDIVCGTPITHLWCDRCATSGRYTADVFVLGKDGLSPIAHLDRCVRCDHDPDEES